MHDRLFDKLDRILDDMDNKEKLSASDVQIVDWATHAQKSMLCREDMDQGGDYSGNSYGSYEGRSYRGRGSNAKRDSMGRYSSNGYSRDYSRNYSGKEEYIDHMRSMMENAPDERTRQSMQRMIREMEQA